MGKRLERRGWGTRDDASSIAMIAVPAGVIGARLYHVITDWERFDGRLIDTVKIWQGGLGIWGGVLVGVLVGMWVAKRRGIAVGNVLTAVAPALPLGQAIGRWGNWFNQELFGRPTTLPWALEIADRKIPTGYASGTLFHPTFLYESLGCLLLIFVLLQLERRIPQRPAQLFFCYVAGYSILRFFVEGLRIDDAKSAGGLRLNQWTSLVTLVSSVTAIIFMVAIGRRSVAASESTAVAQPDLPAQPE